MHIDVILYECYFEKREYSISLSRAVASKLTVLAALKYPLHEPYFCYVFLFLSQCSLFLIFKLHQDARSLDLWDATKTTVTLSTQCVIECSVFEVRILT